MAEFQRDRPAARAVPFDPNPCRIRNPVQRRAKVLGGAEIGLERALGANRLGCAIDAYRAIVDPTRRPVSDFELGQVGEGDVK